LGKGDMRSRVTPNPFMPIHFLLGITNSAMAFFIFCLDHHGLGVFLRHFLIVFDVRDLDYVHRIRSSPWGDSLKIQFHNSGVIEPVQGLF